jgi:hypothetical protein
VDYAEVSTLDVVETTNELNFDAVQVGLWG